MGARGRIWALGALLAWSPAVGGCAQIQELRLYGPARPEVSARVEVTTEQRAGTDGSSECRDVTSTAPMVRDVELRRSFADDTQERDGALAMLLGAGGGVLVFAQSQQGGCSGGACSAPAVSAGVVLGVAAIPLAFLFYNAAAAQDRRIVEPVAPEVRPGAWRACPAGV
ncbi:MAG TPA: hypothetical protein VIJ22_15500, partial [Polyangiaceae bacterium]